MTPPDTAPASVRREVFAAAGGALVLGVVLWAIHVPLGSAAAAIGLAGALAASVVDVREKRLPNKIVFPSVTAVLVLLWGGAVLQDDLGRVAIATAIGGAALVLFGGLWFLRPSSMGYGDVKLAGLLGCAVGWYGPQAALTALVVALLLAAVVAIAMLAAGRSRQAELALGPFLTAGSLIAVLLIVLTRGAG